MLKFFMLLLLVFSCGENTKSSILYKTDSTIEIDEDDNKDSVLLKASHVIPTKNQMNALRDEFIAFVHFGPNTFTELEWGNGMEDPKVFNLENLDTDQWCRAMKDAGMKKVIFTAKHHDGFVLWQSRYTLHGVMSSPFQNGEGDILRELSQSCKKYGIKLGVYLSPADLYQIENKEGLYGNLSEYTLRTIPRPVEDRPFENKNTFEFEVDDYNEYFLNQLFELLTEYGPIDEVWFDGAHPKRKGGQQYNYRDWKKLINELAPNAVVFGKEGTRWCGNEAGGTRDTEWNVVPYNEDPRTMNLFADITAEDVGSIDRLMEGKYLHYQPAETNTSIREGWFYRNENEQKVRNTDDVFDIYERSVGGNSIFLLNIPPNREGKFSEQDVQVLKETGQRIEETYGTNLLENAKGYNNVLDEDEDTFLVLNDDKLTLEFELPKDIKINRFVIQEDVKRHGERVSRHALDAWVNNQWTEILTSTNIGYKRILRFPEVTTNKLRLRILDFRATPVIQHVSAHYYKTRPPVLEIKRSKEGMVNIAPKMADFKWNPNGENPGENLNKGLKIVYTTTGEVPDINSAEYIEPFQFADGNIKAVAILNEELGSVSDYTFGILKENWKILNVDSELKEHTVDMLMDENTGTFWQADENSYGNHFVSLDIGEETEISAFKYTPPTDFNSGMFEKGTIYSSLDGKSWKEIESFEFGNLINDPTPRTHKFKTAFSTRYLKLESDEITGSNTSSAIAELDFYKN
ncbi:alpha-1,3/4-fucosidase [Maribacter hydrothermalis]|uniref:alpha-L-fucosidase n=2 Tax=Maribacter hydrothermalis TaxID=1836467 RepID=A0A1B7YZR9_9FLAO|nr:alpha-1,3/4-fucosidase [Maribacter hydrothermalis]OBR35790.1 alpha-1,3/4-fucosidase [Maribacter hydrothermalis]